jgi:hypothetical protein
VADLEEALPSLSFSEQKNPNDVSKTPTLAYNLAQILGIQIPFSEILDLSL